MSQHRALGRPQPRFSRPPARTCCRTFIASCGVIAPLVMSSSSESVSAMPILDRSGPGPPVKFARDSR